MLKYTCLLIASLTLLCGCAKEPEKTVEAPKEPQVKTNPGSADAQANGAELSVNPNGKSVQPGTKSGN